MLCTVALSLLTACSDGDGTGGDPAGGTAGSSGTGGNAAGGSAGSGGGSGGNTGGTGGVGGNTGGSGGVGGNTGGMGGSSGNAGTGCPNPMPDGMLVCSGFEDGGYGDPSYIFYTAYEEDHTTGTEVIEECEGRAAHEGARFWRRNYYTGAYDPCLGSTPTSENSHNNIDSGIRDTTSNIILVRFWFRLTGDWPNSGTQDGTKWTRLYSGDGSGDDSSWFVNFHENATMFMILDYGNLDWSYFDIPNMNDGAWHSYCAMHERLNDNNQDPNGEVTVWFDDWSMLGAPSGSKQIHIMDESGAFSHLAIFSNWGGASNTPHSEMAVEIDDIEVWDRTPTL